jgi:CheY-like chemotaxis protein
MAKKATEKFLVLMVDDSDDDCLMIQMAMSEAERLRFIGSVPNGEEVMAYMKGAGKYSDRNHFPMPDMMLLDLNMPRKSGFEVLEWLKSQPFDDMVVVVLSGSEKPEDAKKALELGANLYQSKSTNPGKRLELVKVLEQYLTHDKE